MKFHTHVVNYRNDRPRDRRPFFHRKYAWWFCSATEKTLAEGHAEIRIGRPHGASIRFHAGTEGSETPFDAHINIFGVAIYSGLRIGRITGRVANRITHPKNEIHAWEGRDLSLHIFDGRLWLNAWVHDSSWERGEFAAWRNGSWSINPLDYIYGGPKRYMYTDIDSADVVLELHDDSYPVTFKLQRVRHGRPRGRAEQSWAIDWDAPGGIPSHYDRSGGWKGDRTYGSGLNIDRADDWINDGIALLRAWVYKERARSGFREAQPID